MKIPVLDKNENWTMIYEKLEEETEELFEAAIMPKQNNEHIASEALDVIQVCIGILDKLQSEGLNLENATRAHLGKLVNRGWKFKELLEITKI